MPNPVMPLTRSRTSIVNNPREKYFAVHLYEAMDLALKMFKSEAKPQFRDLLLHHAKLFSARLCYRSGKGRAI